MYTIEQVQRGLTNYIEAEIALWRNRMTGPDVTDEFRKECQGKIDALQKEYESAPSNLDFSPFSSDGKLSTYDKMLSKYNGFTAIFVSTLLFVLMHGALQQTVYQLIMGIMLGYVACVGGSILYSIILHFLNNAFVLLFGCFNLVGYLSEETYYYNIYSMIFPMCLFMLGAILVGILFWVLKYLRTKNFFRYTPKKKKKKQAETPVEPKLTLKDMWKNLKYNEKIFAFVSVLLIGIIWLINTISQFIVQ